MTKKTMRDAKIRLYDSSSPAWQLELDFDTGSFSGPMGIPRQEEQLQLDRGVASSDMHNIKGDDYPLMAPVPISFGYFIQTGNQTLYLIDWMFAMNNAGATTVKGQTLETTIADSTRDGSNANPAFADSNKLTCDACYLIETGGSDLGWRYNGVWFPLDQQQLGESESDIPLTLNGQCYGTIEQITAWPAGDPIEEAV